MFPSRPCARELLAGLLSLTLLPLAQTPALAAPAVAAPFEEYYQRYQGERVLGPPITELTRYRAYAAQYFESSIVAP